MEQPIIDDVIEGILGRAIFGDAESVDAELPDTKDRVFYEVVMEERKREDAYLVTGNIKHFPVKPYVVTPREMLDIILEEFDE